MKILKFGGTSIKNAGAFRQVANIIKNYPKPLVVVLSATAGTTDALLQMVELAADGQMEKASALKKKLEQDHSTIIKKLGMEKDAGLRSEITQIFATLEILLIGIYYLREASNRTRDIVISNGELLSTKIFAAVVADAQWFDVRQVMITDTNFGAARPSEEQLQEKTQVLLKPVLAEKGLIVTQGFIGTTNGGQTTTLGRGGSDYTAALLGNVLDAECIEIWTDVSGVMTADPRMVSAAFPQRDLSFKEAAELAYFGAKVIHPSTILPAIKKNIPVLIKNTMKPEDQGTRITRDSNRSGVIKAIAFREEITILTIESSRMLLAHGFLKRIFDIFAEFQISIDLISTSEITVSLTLDTNSNLEEIIQKLSEFSTVKVSKKMSIICMVSEGIKDSPGFLRNVFTALNGIPVEMITFGASNVNLSFLVAKKNMEDAVKRLHKSFFEQTDRD
jgi:aspartate kinase